eukprot:5899966-Pleurochrysis_carterae.AAC.2
MFLASCNEPMCCPHTPMHLAPVDFTEQATQESCGTMCASCSWCSQPVSGAPAPLPIGCSCSQPPPSRARASERPQHQGNGNCACEIGGGEGRADVSLRRNDLGARRAEGQIDITAGKNRPFGHVVTGDARPLVTPYQLLVMTRSFRLFVTMALFTELVPRTNKTAASMSLLSSI